MEKALQTWLPDTVPVPKTRYTIHGCMLILSLSTIHRLTSLSPSTPISTLWPLLTSTLKVTHIASNSPIEDGLSNPLRSPILTPLYGSFGPANPSSPPTPTDLTSAFWCTTKQNGIYQVFAPLYTMFSRGNIVEKARLLALPSVVTAAEEGCSAVDLYAGIGYFAFSYAATGVSRVLCWDLNPWSVEGLVRGAERNKFSVIRAEGGGMLRDERIIVWNEDNALARGRVEQLRGVIPPVRHVNCGMLPTSKGSWATAIDVLDPQRGGWVHVHENFTEGGVETEVEGILEAMRTLATARGKKVEVEGVYKVKTYAPGVVHCVVDLRVFG
ncbi:hypothetical protein K470DRAFT_219529 [Piedraia hortae CBS 480.64]|uniref:tRNA(Phe) (4-demethylwyosine(37)-C(7)) aminocarboxypropyltransferase n=1 Tax=Piedraia hortae CBS 480.64 TaxID=1314780 RepID=A0A6A7BWB6_9PEZI|nr:hypothetical protein K470DRAFT_219529 [Piedraia hortae CBS 480.64]